MYRTLVNNFTQLKRRIDQAMRSITQEMIFKVWNILENSFDAIIKENGSNESSIVQTKNLITHSNWSSKALDTYSQTLISTSFPNVYHVLCSRCMCRNCCKRTKTLDEVSRWNSLPLIFVKREKCFRMTIQLWYDSDTIEKRNPQTVLNSHLVFSKHWFLLHLLSLFFLLWSY